MMANATGWMSRPEYELGPDTDSRLKSGVYYSTEYEHRGILFF